MNLDRQIRYEEVPSGNGVTPIHTIGQGNYEIPAPGSDLPGSRLADANVRIVSDDYSSVIGEAVVRLNHPGYIVTAWSTGMEAMHSLRAAVQNVVESEQALAGQAS